MRQLNELLAIAVFFIVYRMDGDHVQIGDFSYQVDGLYSAILAFTVVVLMQWLALRVLDGRWDRRTGILLAFSVVFQDPRFILWKPTVLNWASALVLLGSRHLLGRDLLQMVMGSHIQMRSPGWLRLNQLWISFFIFSGVLNLWVAQNFSIPLWVNYKFYSAFGFTLLMALLSLLLILRYQESSPPPQPKEDVLQHHQ